jgi:hypothetical protein
MGYLERDVKYHYHPYTDSLFRYDLAADPNEKSPVIVDGPEKQAVIDAIARWREESFFQFSPSRYRESFLYDHWRVFCTGRRSTAYYVADR